MERPPATMANFFQRGILSDFLLRLFINKIRIADRQGNVLAEYYPGDISQACELDDATLHFYPFRSVPSRWTGQRQEDARWIDYRVLKSLLFLRSSCERTPNSSCTGGLHMIGGSA
jgi:hypothetical protein